MNFGPHQRYFLYLPPCDMRRSFAGLTGMVTNEMQRDCTTGDVFLFINKNRNKIKLLVWDRTGFAIYYKQLTEGTFELPQACSDSQQLSVSWENLIMILEGIQLKSVRLRKRKTH